MTKKAEKFKNENKLDYNKLLNSMSSKNLLKIVVFLTFTILLLNLPSI